MRLLHVFVCMNIYYTYSMYLRYEILMNIAAVEKARKHKTTSRFAPKGFTILCIPYRHCYKIIYLLLLRLYTQTCLAKKVDAHREVFNIGTSAVIGDVRCNTAARVKYRCILYSETFLLAYNKSFFRSPAPRLKSHFTATAEITRTLQLINLSFATAIFI